MTSSTPNQPTILLVQGSSQLPDAYEKFAKALEARGYPVVHPHLPTLTDPDEPDFTSKTLATDALAIQSALRRLVEDEARNVFVVMHSYGGLVGSEAVLEEFSRENRKEKGLAGGVFHLFYFAAFILAVGQSVVGVLGEGQNIDIQPDRRFRVKNPAHTLYNDLEPEEAEYWASKAIYQSWGAQTTELTNAAYCYIPSTYVVCQNDNGPPPKFQEMCGKSIGATVIRIASGHSPQLSRTEEFADMVSVAAQGALKDID